MLLIIPFAAVAVSADVVAVVAAAVAVVVVDAAVIIVDAADNNAAVAAVSVAATVDALLLFRLLRLLQ